MIVNKIEKCDMCKKEICFERTSSDMPEEYEVCCECGVHICSQCSRVDDNENVYCDDCHIIKETKERGIR